MSEDSDYKSDLQLHFENKQLIREASRNSDDNSSRIEKLERRLENLSLITEALWELVSVELKVGDVELKNKMEHVISNRDNRKKEKAECTGCGMQVPASKNKCMYCGNPIAEKPDLSPFDE